MMGMSWELPRVGWGKEVIRMFEQGIQGVQEARVRANGFVVSVRSRMEGRRW